MDGFDADFALAPEHIGMILAVGLLKDEKVLEFIAEVREREGIDPPLDRQELEENLIAYPPERFIEEATPVAEDAFERGVFDETLEGFDPDTLAAQLPAEATAFAEQFAGMFEEFFQVEDHIPTSARIIARHIVTGLLEVPEPLPLSSSVVGKLSISEDESMLIAVIPPYANIEAATRQIEEAFRKHYGRGKRSSWPGTFTETLWLRHCAFEFPAERGEDASYRRLATLALEVWPELRPQAKGNSPEWGAAVERHMERIRKNNKAFEERKEQGFWGAET